MCVYFVFPDFWNFQDVSSGPNFALYFFVAKWLFLQNIIKFDAMYNLQPSSGASHRLVMLRFKWWSALHSFARLAIQHNHKKAWVEIRKGWNKSPWQCAIMLKDCNVSRILFFHFLYFRFLLLSDALCIKWVIHALWQENFQVSFFCQ